MNKKQIDEFLFISMNHVSKLAILIILNYLIGGLKHVKNLIFGFLENNSGCVIYFNNNNVHKKNFF